MRILVFSARPYDREYLEPLARKAGHEIAFIEARLKTSTASIAAGHEAVCIFVNDIADAGAIAALAEVGVKVIALRCAGFNNVDLDAARRHDITVVRVPVYSPHAVAEHTVALILTLNRKIHRAHARVREGNFELQGLLGFDLHGKTVGVIGTGSIGQVFARIMLGFGCEVIAHDLYPRPDLQAAGVRYCPLPELFERSHMISLHCPLTPETYHLIDADALARMRRHVMLINTSRGGLVDTRAIIEALKSERLGGLAIDVYEEEGHLFFRDLSGQVIQDDTFARLLTFPNVLITAHQAFFTREALQEIAQTTVGNLSDIEAGRGSANAVTADKVA